MARISTYNIDPNITADDKWIGTDFNTQYTKNFTPQYLADFFNISNSIGVSGQVSFKYYSTFPSGRPEESITTPAVNPNFSAVTSFKIHKNSGGGNYCIDFINYLSGDEILISDTSNADIFGHFKLNSVTQDLSETNFYNLNVTYIGGNGNLQHLKVYSIALYSAAITNPPIPNLQQVTNIGSVTTNSITVAGIYSGNLYSDGFSFGISDSYDANYNLLYIPYSGLTLDDFSGNITNIGYGNITLNGNSVLTTLNIDSTPTNGSANAVSSDGVFDALGTKQNALSGTGIVKSTAGTISYINGTTAQYVRGDGTLATFPSTAIPTLQQVVTAGNSITTPFTHSSVSYENTFNAAGINIIDKSIPGLSSSMAYQINGMFRGYTGLSQALVFGPFDGLSPTSRTITIPNATGTMALLSDIPTYTIPTLQQVTTAGSTTTNSILIENTGVSPRSVFLTNTGISLVDTFTGKSVAISTTDDIIFGGAGGSSLYLKSPVTISGTNTQTLQNASGTIALLSDVGVTSVTATSPITSSGGATPIISTSMATNKLIGRSTAGTGVMEEITIGTGLTLSGGTLNGSATGVTSVGLTMPSAFSVTNSPITSSGDIAVTGAGLVSQYVRGDGTLANFPNSTGGGSSVNYYLNGSVSQGTFGGDTYYQMSKTPILGAGTNFTRTNGAGNGYIASFITDAGDPSQLNIPGGNWNVEFYFNASSGGGSPSFYAELYKVSATNVFTLIASDSLNPEGITNGTTVDQYYTSIPVPQTTLLVTDRLAVRIFVNTGGRTITLHTENGNLSEVLTTFTTGLTALNGLTQQVQFFDVGTTGTDFNISSVTDTHTFNLPTASAANRGALSSTDWNTFNAKADLGLVQAMTQGLQNIF
jgi:hypothetical protein